MTDLYVFVFIVGVLAGAALANLVAAFRLRAAQNELRRGLEAVYGRYVVGTVCQVNDDGSVLVSIGNTKNGGEP